MASALVRDVARTYPGVVFGIEGGATEEIFRFDTRLSPIDPTGARALTLDTKPAVDACSDDKTRRYAFALHDDWEAQTGLALPRDRPYPELVLGPAEYIPPYPFPYALAFASTKTDMPLKAAPLALFDGAVRLTADRWKWLQCGAMKPEGSIKHIYGDLPGCESLLGQTSIRDLIRLVAHASVVLCHLSLPAVLASAFGTPCVVLAGGRESPWFFDGLGVDLLHTIGRLPCCQTQGCYRRVALPPHADSPLPPNWCCADPVAPPDDMVVGRCMTLFTAEEVANRLVTAASKGRVRSLTLSRDGIVPSPAPPACF